jgi:phosphopantothenoylcysteine decarboxylase/phosphopantothenate--cysteine ligase
MRYLSAHSSGRTGVAIAQAAPGDVFLLGSPEARLRGPDVAGETFGSTRDLLARMEGWCRAHPTGVVVHACAVGDYEVAEAGGKIPSGQAELTLTLRPTPKILDRIRGWSPDLRIVSFKAAPPESTPTDLARIAEAQRARTDSALVFANTIGRLSEGIVLVDADGATHHPTRAAALADLQARIAALRS